MAAQLRISLSCALYCTGVNLHFLLPEAFYFTFGVKIEQNKTVLL